MIFGWIIDILGNKRTWIKKIMKIMLQLQMQVIDLIQISINSHLLIKMRNRKDWKIEREVKRRNMLESIVMIYSMKRIYR